MFTKIAFYTLIPKDYRVFVGKNPERLNASGVFIVGFMKRPV
jgi:hypothetical protein